MQSVTDAIFDLLESWPKPTSAGQIQSAMTNYVELPEIASRLVNLERRGLLVSQLGERIAGRGRRQIKLYQLTPAGYAYCDARRARRSRQAA